MRMLALIPLLAAALAMGCAAPQSPAAGDRDTASTAAAPAPTTSADAGEMRASQPAAPAAPPTSGTGIPGRTKPAPRMSTPLPPEVADDAPARGAPTLVTSCRTDADCTVKDVGSCCGTMPACVNKASPTDPAAVQAACAREGRMSTCGFREIQACSCVAGTCRDAGGGEIAR